MRSDVDWDLLAKYFAGECSDEETRKINSDPAFEPYIKFFASYLGTVGQSSEMTYRWDVEAAIKKVHAQASIPDSTSGPVWEPRLESSPSSASSGNNRVVLRRVNLNLIVRVAAVIVLLIGLSYLSFHTKLIFRGTRPASDLAYIFSTGRGEQKVLLLPDGSKVTLNSMTKVEFLHSFGEKNRVIKLQGEAFFTVIHKRMPFVVRTSSGTVQDVSTEFNVKAWPGEEETEVTVKEGEVILKAGDSARAKAVKVYAGQVSAVAGDSITFAPVRADVNAEIAWLRGSMVFVKTPLRQVIANLERQYPYSFVVADPSLLSETLTATFQKQPLSEIMKAIALSLNINYRKKGETVFFEKRNANRSSGRTNAQGD